MTKARDLADLLDASGNLKEKQGRTVGGRDLKNDGDKLDGIEAGATGDQTHSEIRALITAGVDTNVFTDADHSKLDGIEAGATADQTAAEIKTAYESNANTNEFSDAEQSKLAGIETGATGDQTASEIRSLVEAATDSNVFTDADHSKLNGIEAAATADQTKADIDALNVDADTLDGQHGSYYTSYADTAVANIVDSAPGTLDTLNELAAALGDDPNFATTTATNIGTKANKTITVSAGSGLTGGGDLTANRTISHADTSTVSDVNGSGNTFIQDIGFDTYGHVTSVGTGTVTVGDGAMTVTAGSGLSGGGQLGTANQSSASSVTVSHADTSSQASVNNSNGTVIQDITLDTYGHITGIASTNLDGRYYTETEADSRFIRSNADDSFSGDLTTRDSGWIKFYAAEETDSNDGKIGSGLFASGLNIVGAQTIAGTGRQIRIWGTLLDSSSQKYFHDGYHPNADKWTTARTLSLSGDASGSVSWDGSGNATLSVNIADATVLSKGGDITGSTNWDDFINGTEASWNNVFNFSGANGPSGAYTYGTALSFSDNGRNAFQLYAPENASNGNGLRYRTTWNNASRNWVKIWDSGNDGSGSGLDADLLDGQQGSYYYSPANPPASGAPAGSIIYHAGSSAPSGYVKANGASLSTSTYAALFSAIGYTYGGSGGSFNVPDLRGEFIRGWDDGRGVDSGRGFGSFQSDDFASHSHTAYGAYSSTWFSVYARSGSWGSERYITTNSYQTASTGGADTRPRNRAMLACIKI